MNKTLLALLFSLSSSGCSTLLENLPGVYRIDIEQGNIVTQEMVDQLRPNMNKRQVLYIMGSPMLQDAFHKNRWDYIYSKQPGNEARVQKRLTLLFKNEKLSGLQGDFRPSSKPVMLESKETTVEVPKRELDKTLWEIITGWFSSEPDLEAIRQRQSTNPPESEKDSDSIDNLPNHS
jgi:outer membrane protein assembly factor BamE